MIYFCVRFQKDPLFGVNLTFLHLGYYGNGRHFEFVQPLKSCHTLRWIFLQSFMRFDERNKKKKIHLFLFPWQLRQICPTDSNFFGISRSTRCGCCSYQVSSISVWRVTCCDHFCVFQFFSILAVSMATVAILKKSTLSCRTSHGI